MTGGTSVEVAELEHRYRAPGGAGEVVALAGVTLSVRSGEALAVVGGSGSGKSTLLRILAGVDRPTGGIVGVDGVDLATLRPRERRRLRRRIGTVPQDLQLAPALNALDNVVAALSPCALGAAARSRAEVALAEVGLEHRGSCLPAELSAGERRRLAVARAIAGEPRLLLADEPTGDLDPFTGRGVLGLLWRTWERLGTTLVLVTHDPIAVKTCDRVVRLHDGRLCS